jgi:hypothetical protein
MPSRPYAKFPGPTECNCHKTTVEIIEGAGGSVPDLDPVGFNPGLRPTPTSAPTVQPSN